MGLLYFWPESKYFFKIKIEVSQFFLHSPYPYDIIEFSFLQGENYEKIMAHFCFYVVKWPEDSKKILGKSVQTQLQ